MKNFLVSVWPPLDLDAPTQAALTQLSRRLLLLSLIPSGVYLLVQLLMWGYQQPQVWAAVVFAIKTGVTALASLEIFLVQQGVTLGLLFAAGTFLIVTGLRHAVVAAQMLNDPRPAVAVGGEAREAAYLKLNQLWNATNKMSNVFGLVVLVLLVLACLAMLGKAVTGTLPSGTLTLAHVFLVWLVYSVMSAQWPLWLLGVYAVETPHAFTNILNLPLYVMLQLNFDLPQDAPHVER